MRDAVAGGTKASVVPEAGDRAGEQLEQSILCLKPL